jgi:hypothetical protein
MTVVRPAAARTRPQSDGQPADRPIVAEPRPRDAVALPRKLALSSAVKRVAAPLAVLAPLGLLSACSPAVTAVSAIGYDSQGCLVGADTVLRRRLLRGAPRPDHARRPAAPAELADAAIADVGGQR